MIFIKTNVTSTKENKHRKYSHKRILTGRKYTSVNTSFVQWLQTLHKFIKSNQNFCTGSNLTPGKSDTTRSIETIHQHYKIPVTILQHCSENSNDCNDIIKLLKFFAIHF